MMMAAGSPQGVSFLLLTQTPVHLYRLSRFKFQTHRREMHIFSDPLAGGAVRAAAISVGQRPRRVLWLALISGIPPASRASAGLPFWPDGGKPFNECIPHVVVLAHRAIVLVVGAPPVRGERIRRIKSRVAPMVNHTVVTMPMNMDK